MTLRSLPSLLASLHLVLVSTGAEATTYDVDPSLSRVRFTIAHSSYAKQVRGRFDRFSGTVDHDASAPERVLVDVTIHVASLSTANRYRDSHLRTSFFETEDFPEALFTADRLDTSAAVAKLHGHLTIKGITKPVVLDVRGAGLSTDAAGRGLLRHRASTTIDRRDFGVEEDADRNRGLGKLLAHVQEGLDEFVDDDVEIDVILVARERLVEP